jgi:hypothetical protein
MLGDYGDFDDEDNGPDPAQAAIDANRGFTDADLASCVKVMSALGEEHRFKEQKLWQQAEYKHFRYLPALPA